MCSLIMENKLDFFMMPGLNSEPILVLGSSDILTVLVCKKKVSVNPKYYRGLAILQLHQKLVNSERLLKITEITVTKRKS